MYSAMRNNRWSRVDGRAHTNYFRNLKCMNGDCQLMHRMARKIIASTHDERTPKTRPDDDTRSEYKRKSIDLLGEMLEWSRVRETSNRLVTATATQRVSDLVILVIRQRLDRWQSESAPVRRVFSREAPTSGTLIRRGQRQRTIHWYDSFTRRPRNISRE